MENLDFRLRRRLRQYLLFHLVQQLMFRSGRFRHHQNRQFLLKQDQVHLLRRHPHKLLEFQKSMMRILRRRYHH
jgi:hypothetical protein